LEVNASEFCQNVQGAHIHAKIPAVLFCMLVGTGLGSVDGKESHGIDFIEGGQQDLESVTVDYFEDFGFIRPITGDPNLQGEGDMLKLGIIGLEEESARRHSFSNSFRNHGSFGWRYCVLAIRLFHQTRIVLLHV
jgi:hypothetical protein